MHRPQAFPLYETHEKYYNAKDGEICSKETVGVIELRESEDESQSVEERPSRDER
jgi:hypothetical protein